MMLLPYIKPFSRSSWLSGYGWIPQHATKVMLCSGPCLPLLLVLLSSCLRVRSSLNAARSRFCVSGFRCLESSPSHPHIFLFLLAFQIQLRHHVLWQASTALLLHTRHLIMDLLLSPDWISWGEGLLTYPFTPRILQEINTWKKLSSEWMEMLRPGKLSPPRDRWTKPNFKVKIIFIQINGDGGPQCVLKAEGGFIKVKSRRHSPSPWSIFSITCSRKK